MIKNFLIFTVTIFSNIVLALPGGGNGNDPCQNPNPPPGCPVIPIDNHLIWLFIIGIGLTAFQLYKINKSKIIA